MGKDAFPDSSQLAPRAQGERRKPYRRHGTWRAPFLKELRTRGNVRDACRAVRVDRHTVYYARRQALAARKPSAPIPNDFAAQWDDAIDEAISKLESEVYRRAVIGRRDPVYYRGKKVGHIKRYSDQLLILLLKGHRPAKYRENYRAPQEPSPETRALLEKHYEAIGKQARS